MKERKMIRKKEVLAIFGGISTATMYRYINAGKIPRSTKLSPFISVWDEAEVREALEKFFTA
jgi:predicted DNA-binding transcriptional regulator AlpA